KRCCWKSLRAGSRWSRAPGLRKGRRPGRSYTARQLTHRAGVSDRGEAVERGARPIDLRRDAIDLLFELRPAERLRLLLEIGAQRAQRLRVEIGTRTLQLVRRPRKLTTLIRGERVAHRR